MVPMQSAAGLLTGITKSGVPVSYTTQTIKGVQYAFFNTSGGDYVAQYPSPSPTVTSQTPAPGASNVATNTTVTATFDRSVVAATISFVLKDSSNSTVAATVSYSDTNHTATLTPNAPLANSVTYTATVSGAQDASGKIMAAPVTWSFTTIGTGPVTIWSSSVAPTTVDSGDPNAVELGVKFRSDLAGQISSIRFYKSAANTGVHVGNLWSSTGTLLASATFTNETASGWQQINFSTPVSIQANTTYVASYHTNVGHYSDDDNYFTTGVDNAPLHALKDGLDGGNGVYFYGSSSGFPNQPYLASNYWVDIVFNKSTTGAGPTVTSKTPASGATNVATNTTVTATFDRSVVAATISFVLKDSSNSTVAATVSYSDTNHTATLTPNAPLANSITYTATVSGAQDSSGSVMAAPVSWSFSTAAAAIRGPVTIWSSSVTPTNVDSGDPNAVELGVKFRSDVAGQISSILFYKSAANIGVHVGNLWSSTGTLLASATFTNETASGWEQVNFSTPVSIQANTTYVASYHTNVGHFSDDHNYFATSGVDNAPLHALKNGVDGGNGVFLYGLISGFPNQSYLSSNYWVDVVFNQVGGGALPPSLSGDNSPQLSSDVLLGNSLSPGSVTIPVTPLQPNGTWLGAGGGPVGGNFSTVGSGPIDGGTAVLDAIFIQMTKTDTATSTRSEALPDGFTDPLGREGWLA
jgi:hypothetical protein